MSTFIGWWFYYKLDVTTIKLPLYNLTEKHWINFDLQNISLPLVGSLGWLIIPLIVLILVSIWSTSIIDGFDGLATGVFIPVFLCFAGLAFIDKYYNIATLLMVMVGTMWAYLWFNIPPAKFFLGDTGTMGVLMTLGVVAIFINKVYVLPIAGLLLYLVAISAIIQVFSKKFFKKKIFLAAPLHHHLEAKGWTREQVTMRFWMISTITSLLGFAVGLLVK
jgi:phospho-N-acetylmuramoyl-pentapeptide-transferase